LFTDHNGIISHNATSNYGSGVVKLLSRIVAPDVVLENFAKSSITTQGSKIALSLHDHTYGITSDPLTHLACVFSSLIHDAGHTGVPNSQLAKENKELAEKYKGKSVAEQYSLHLAWKLFMNVKYKNLRNVICETEHEMIRFRQLVVNSGKFIWPSL
jgi:3'5'-cyclic nucleotide phosphodiesterase